MSGVKLGGRESDLTIPECGLAIMVGSWCTGGEVFQEHHVGGMLVCGSWGKLPAGKGSPSAAGVPPQLHGSWVWNLRDLSDPYHPLRDVSCEM